MILTIFQYFTGVSATTLATRPSFDGFEYHADEFCDEEAIYGTESSSIEEAVSKCRNDPMCAAIEDRWGTGKPPITLCKKKRGKRAGGGTYLLKKGISFTKFKNCNNLENCS